MSTGIAAAIPLVITPHKNMWKKGFDKSNFSRGFFNNYTVDQDGQIYTIKEDLLLNNYQSFFKEFTNCISSNDDYKHEIIPTVSSYGEFISTFDRENRDDYPFLEYDGGFFSILGGVCKEFWLFYYGSCKAYLETYTTLLHFELTLEKAMKNPLASSVKFGIYG